MCLRDYWILHDNKKFSFLILFLFVYAALPCVVLRTRKSLFWRYQLGKPDSYLATIEAIYDAVVSLDERRRGSDADGGSSYDGSYDNLLFFFRYFYEKMEDLYFHKSPAVWHVESISVVNRDIIDPLHGPNSKSVCLWLKWCAIHVFISRKYFW